MSPKQTSRTPGFYPAGLSESTCVPVGARPARLRSTATGARHPRRVCSTCPQEDRSLRQGRRRAATTPRTTMVGYAARGRGHRIRGDRTLATAARRACRACPLPDADRGLGGGGAGGPGGRAGARAAGAYRPAAEARAAARLRERPGVEAARAGEGVVTMEGWTVVAAPVVAGALLVLAREVRRARVPRDDAGALLLLQQQLDALRAQLSEALAGQGRLVGQQLALLTGQMNDRLREGLELVQRSQSAVGERLDNTSRVVGEVQKGLGELREATAKVYEVGRDVASLHDILRAPKLRGGLGEFLLGDLLAQVLPSAHFTLQHAFRSGERVDAVVRLGDGLVPVDAKFPLEDFRRLLEAADDDERARARKAFVAQVRRHVDDIATKYVLPDEGTYDFALMYIPAENVYYETIIRDEEPGLAAYAIARKVIPVSPNCFYAYLQAIAFGLRGLRIEARAQEVMGLLARLGGDLDRLKEDFRLGGKHLTNAAQAYGAAERRLARLGGKLVAIGGEEPAEDAPRQAFLLRSS